MSEPTDDPSTPPVATAPTADATWPPEPAADPPGELSEAEAAELELNAVLEAEAADEDLPVSIPSETLEQLGGSLVWKIGKDEFSDAIVVRVGYAKATRRFRTLPKLRSATDVEIADAARRGDLVIEWIE